MTTVTIENAPENFIKKFGKKVDFSQMIWIYWDWMDWCQYDEVIIGKNDFSASENCEKNLWEKDGKAFLEKLISE